MGSNMHDIKSRITSIKQTMQITKAMKLISGVKLKKAREQLEQTTPYFLKIRATLADILEHTDNIENKCLDLYDTSVGTRKAFIVISGDKGMVGGYNNAIIKFTEKFYDENPDSTLYVAGNTGRKYFSKPKYKMVKDFYYNVQSPTIFRARDIAEMILDKFLLGEHDEVYVIFTHMNTAISQEPKIMKLLPLERNSIRLAAENLSVDVRNTTAPTQKKGEISVRHAYDYEPDANTVFDHLIPKYLKGIIYGALVEAYTCEQNARMMAMDSATTNAEEIISDLGLYYNRARQAQITQEISEIVGGATAME